MPCLCSVELGVEEGNETIVYRLRGIDNIGKVGGRIE